MGGTGTPNCAVSCLGTRADATGNSLFLPQFPQLGHRPIQAVLDPPLVHQQPIKHPLQIEVLHRPRPNAEGPSSAGAGGCQFDSASTASILDATSGGRAGCDDSV